MLTKDPEITHFQSIPWVANLLSDESFKTIPTPSRQSKETTEDSFFAHTLNSPTTISACLTQYKLSRNGGEDEVEQLRMFITLGCDVNGYPRTLHGGMVSSLLDESMGLLLMVRGDVAASKDRERSGPNGEAGRGESHLSETPVTAYLNIRFLRPVITPGTVVLRTQLKEAKENRKWTIEGKIRDEEGRDLARGECLYVKIRAKV